MSSSLSIPILILAAVLQTTVVPALMRAFNGEPDLIFLIVLSWSVKAPFEQALLWAFVGGISADLLSAAPTGTTVVGLALTVAMVSVLREQVVRVSLLWLIPLAVLGTVLHKTAYVIILALVGSGPPIAASLLAVGIPTLAYNMVALLPVYFLVRLAQRSSTRAPVIEPSLDR